MNGNGKIDPEENFYDNSLSLIKAIVSGKYPSPPARNLFLVSNGVPTKPVVVEFIKYILTEGQKYANATGYIGLSKTTINQELAKLKNRNMAISLLKKRLFKDKVTKFVYVYIDGFVIVCIGFYGYRAFYEIPNDIK